MPNSFVPQGSGTQDVQIILIDANGQRTVYQGAQKAGVRIRQKVEVTGSGKVQFFCNNKNGRGEKSVSIGQGRIIKPITVITMSTAVPTSLSPARSKAS